MASSDEHLRLTANYLNIAAGGALVAAFATVPVGFFTSGKMDGWSVTDMVVIYTLLSGFLHGVAQVLLTRISP